VARGLRGGFCREGEAPGDRCGHPSPVQIGAPVRQTSSEEAFSPSKPFRPGLGVDGILHRKGGANDSPTDAVRVRVRLSRLSRSKERVTACRGTHAPCQGFATLLRCNRLCICHRRVHMKIPGEDMMTAMYHVVFNRIDTLAKAPAALATLVLFLTPAISVSTEIWQLTKREYPVLPHAVVDVLQGSNAGSFIKVRRTQNKNEVVYSSRQMVRGNQQCLWISGFQWDDNLPETIQTGSQISVDLASRFDRHLGHGCGMGSISVTYGNRDEPLRDRAPNIVRIKAGHADPDPGGVHPPASTEIFVVNERPDLPHLDMFTVAIHISDGAVTDEVVALYVYEKSSVGETRTMRQEFNSDRPGHDYRNFVLSSPVPRVCAEACEEDAKCKAWTYVKPNTIQGEQARCWLKDSVPPARGSSCCISGIK
jgi:hypothetical protein